MENTEFATWVESRIRATLPYEQLYDNVKSEITVTEEEVRQQYYDDNNKAEAKIIFFDPKKENIEGASCHYSHQTRQASACLSGRTRRYCWRESHHYIGEAKKG